MSVKGTAAKGSACIGRSDRVLISLLWICAGATLIGLGGCAVQKYIPAGPLPYEDLSRGYFQIALQKSSALEVIRTMQSLQGTVDPDHVGKALFSQSDTVSASSGRSKDSKKSWFTLCAFDQYDMKVMRKYFFYMDESALVTPTPPRRWLIPPRGTLVFDSALVISEVMEKPYASDAARSIAVLRYIAESLRDDVSVFDASSSRSSSGNDILAVSGMLMNQVLRSTLLELDKSPSLALQMHKQGMQFSHMTLNQGRIRLKVQGEAAVIRIELGLPQ
jgi:hypothetical protein